jgi:hypothetical protein
MKSNRRLFQRLLTGRLGFEGKIQALNTFFRSACFSIFRFRRRKCIWNFSERPETCFRWDGSIILFVLSFIEVTNYGVYRPGESTSFSPFTKGGADRSGRYVIFLKLG